MSNKVKGFFIVVVTIIIVGGIITGGFFITRAYYDSDEFKQKFATKFSPFPLNTENTAGNWTFIPTDYHRNFGGFNQRFDPSSIHGTLDRFEREHPNLSIRDWKIVYDPLSDYPHGILIWHTPK